METQTPPRRKGLPPAIRTLIWMVIIGILSAWLVLSYLQARESARRASCLNNLKQLGLGLMIYSRDFGDVYPWRVGMSNRQDAWRDLGLLYPQYLSDSKPFFCPSTKDKRSQLEREFFGEMRGLKQEERPGLEPIKSSGSRAVISYSYGLNAGGGVLEGKEYACLPWTGNAESTVRILADKKAGRKMTGQSSHYILRGRPQGRNVLYRDGLVRWRAVTGPLDPNEEDDEIGAPDARDYTDWWSDPPYYGE